VKVLSDKYIAGFLDGDGGLSLSRGTCLFLEFHQKLTNDGVIELISQRIPGGGLHIRKSRTRGKLCYARRLVYTGQRAVDILCRLKPYLVTKRVRANRLLRELGFAERVGTDSVPVHPSRKWLAGYFDADGCVHAAVNPHGGSATMSFSIDTDDTEKDGIELVQKAFGGALRHRGSGRQWRWEMKADAAKAKAFLSYFAPHLINKKEQAYFVLGCAGIGHFRDGQVIHDVLRSMKTRPHRLSDVAIEVDVSAELTQVRNLQPTLGVRYQHAAGQLCRACGADKLYAKGLCSPCWQAVRYYASSQPSHRKNVVDPALRSKRQSELAVYG